MIMISEEKKPKFLPSNGLVYLLRETNMSDQVRLTNRSGKMYKKYNI